MADSTVENRHYHSLRIADPPRPLPHAPYLSIPPLAKPLARARAPAPTPTPAQNQSQQQNRQPNGEPQQPAFLRAAWDCFNPRGLFRDISYDLQDANGNNLRGYYVTEHMTFRSNGEPDVEISGPGGMTTHDPDPVNGDSGFPDQIGGHGTHDDLQTFTASTTKAGGESIPLVIIDINNKTWGTNGIYMSNGAVYVNGDISEPPCHY